MLGTRSIFPTLLLAVAACSSAAQLTLPPLPQGLPPGSLQAEVATGSQVPLQTAVIVPGTPTEVYALVARGALGCWFGAGGPLKGTHVFEAVAEPPASGGAAEIVLYERDETLRDKRGARALRVEITSSQNMVRAGTTPIRFGPPLAQAMSKDVATWARGGSGCEARAVLPPPPPQVPVGKKKAVGSSVGKR